VFSLCRPAAVNGQTTGSIEGRVLELSGQALSDVLVEAKSPSLQGTRTATTAADGGYRLRGLPPGATRCGHR
jgi:protocatechuate 3,4-dioxygenase beta subunit